MKLIDLLAGDAVFVDSNPLVYHFGPDPIHGPACHQFVARITNQEITAYSSTRVLGELAHQLMLLEASQRFTRPSKVAQYLRQQPSQIQQLTIFRRAVETVPQLGIQVLTIAAGLPAIAADLSQQFGLLTNDATIVALMRLHGLTKVASADADFDRVPGITRYAPS